MTVHKKSTRIAGSAALFAGLVLAATVPQPQIAHAGAKGTAAAKAAQPESKRSIPAKVAPRPQPAAVPVSPEQLTAQRILDARIQAIGRDFNGDVGIAVKDIESGWSTAFDGSSLFPQQSVSKFWVALTAFDKADQGKLDLDQAVTVRRSDMTLFHQPIAALIKGDGYDTTVSSLMNRALQQSDNTANDFVLRQAGGPEAVRDFLARKGIDGIRFGPGERLMQSQIAGMSWKPEYSQGRNFYTARANVPRDTRAAAFNRYVSDPVDGATPLGIVDALARLKKGELLSPASTSRLLSIMSNTRTGPQRLKGGLSSGYTLAHKTGTGQVLGATQSGYNDIGIVTAPNGKSYAVAVMIRQTSAPIPTRMQMMQSVTRAVIDYDRNLQDG